jgi:hypothetical protein
LVLFISALIGLLLLWLASGRPPQAKEMSISPLSSLFTKGAAVPTPLSPHEQPIWSQQLVSTEVLAICCVGSG